MRRQVFLTLLLCCLPLLLSAQANRTVSTNRTASGTTNSRNVAAPVKQEIPLIPVGLFSAQELESQRLEAFKIIELTTQLLNETNVFAKNSLNRLNLLAQQLLSRRKVVAILGQEINELDRKIKTLTDDIALLDKDLTKIKENYAKSMQNQQQEYRATQYKLLLILSADNLSQTYRRMRYLREYALWQKEEAERIVTKQSDLMSRKEELEKTRSEKQELLKQRENENKKLIDEEKFQQREVRELNTKQKELQRLLDQKRKEADALNREIDRLIAEDIKNSEKNIAAAANETEASGAKAIITTPSEIKSPDTTSAGVTTPSGMVVTTTSSSEATSSGTGVSATTSSGAGVSAPVTSAPAAKTAEAKSPASGNSYVLLGSEALISKEFESSKGKLPFPLTGNYTIVSSFGEQQHQELSYVRTNNNGIDIQTTAGTEVNSIFRGVVTRVFVMPGFNNNVIIRHGDFLSVYSNLSQVYVKAGDVVSTSQIIGKIFTDTEKGNETVLHFQLWKERTKLNPALWVK